MKEPSFISLVFVVVFSSMVLVAGLYLLTNYHRLFRKHIRNELLRMNIVVWMTALCLIFSLSPTSPEFYKSLTSFKLFHYFLHQLLGVTSEALVVFNITYFVIKQLSDKKISFRNKMLIILLTIITCCILSAIPISYYTNEKSFKNLQFSIIYAFYNGCMTGFVYVTMSYVALERKRKLNEKELEVSRLQALKTKAELDALHSKINPHFLYNALNSIADLAITDGKKARKMTVALADLFRYSINYTNHNFSTVKEEVEMAEVYLEIEKIRFEDQLNYTVHIGEEVQHYLIPRFILQTVVENAVKHGLKVTGRLTEIIIDVKKEKNGIALVIGDNGPAFPDEMIPGYGIKSLYDKLDLLFPGNYEIHFSNQPRKQVSIYIQKLMKNEPGI